MNSHGITSAIQAIMPYRKFGTWVFDDPHFGLVREPFVLGIPEMIDVMVADIPNADNGFRLTFSLRRSPKSSGVHHLKFMAHEKGGAWYRDVETRMGGWLCPATLIYFNVFPQEMFIWADEMFPSIQSATHTMNQTLIEEMGLEPKHSAVIWTNEEWKAYLDEFGISKIDGKECY